MHSLRAAFEACDCPLAETPLSREHVWKLFHSDGDMYSPTQMQHQNIDWLREHGRLAANSKGKGKSQSYPDLGPDITDFDVIVSKWIGLELPGTGCLSQRQSDAMEGQLFMSIARDRDWWEDVIHCSANPLVRGAKRCALCREARQKSTCDKCGKTLKPNLLTSTGDFLHRKLG